MGDCAHVWVLTSASYGCWGWHKVFVCRSCRKRRVDNYQLSTAHPSAGDEGGTGR